MSVVCIFVFSFFFDPASGVSAVILVVGVLRVRGIGVGVAVVLELVDGVATAGLGGALFPEVAPPAAVAALR